MKTLHLKSFQAFTWDYLGRIAQRATSFGVGVLLARLLTPSEFGVVGMVMVFVAYGEMFTGLGLGEAIIQGREIALIDYDTAFFSNLLLSVLMLMALFIGAPWVSSFYGVSSLTPLLRVLALGMAFRSLSLVPQAILRRRLRFDSLAQVNFLGTLLGGAAGVVLALFGYGVWALVAQNLMVSVVATALIYPVAGWRPRIRFSVRSLRNLMSFGGPMFLASLLHGFYSRLDTLVIGKLFSARDLGLFSRAKSLTNFTVSVSSESLSQVAFSTLSRIQDSKDQLTTGTKAMLTVVGLAAFGLVGWLYSVAASLVIFLLTERWAEAIPLVRLLCLGMWVAPVSAALLAPLKAAGFAQAFLRLEVIKKGIGLVAMGVGFYFGVEGYLIAFAVAGVVVLLLNMRFSCLATGLTVGEQFRILLPPGLSAVLAAGIVLLATGQGVSIWNIIAKTLVFSVVYGTSVLLISKPLRELLMRLRKEI